MPDEADTAQYYEERDRALAIDAMLPRLELPLLIRGLRVCKVCGEPIGKARLAALPAAVRCIECQQNLEQGDGLRRR